MPGIEARFSESSASKYSLKIDNLGAEDSATYYCQSGEDGADWCGCGITLKVKPTVLPRPPSVNLHYAPPQKDSQQTESSLLLKSSGYLADVLDTLWIPEAVGCLILLILVVILIHKKATSSSRTGASKGDTELEHQPQVTGNLDKSYTYRSQRDISLY
ncbi:hypothetical protein chiPu_0010574 [Chiloscyllium punctatum]|uniref:Immunoglobulin V-set domain-containing protein n=1 Tax=Chiloscyllium punctatum TaxID=137246 RepID=A0A401SNZ2_CHIPU|nr:hypothetical protein [Chiloscyllium punctatum]